MAGSFLPKRITFPSFKKPTIIQIIYNKRRRVL